jgi:predicted HTH transcriptional regulator
MPTWKFISNHGIVLLLIAQKGDITARQLSEIVGITERSIQRIIKDLQESGYLQVKKIGRSNSYRINREAAIRVKGLGGIPLGEVLSLFENQDFKPV